MTTCKGVVCLIYEIIYPKCEVSSDSELCNLKLSAIPPYNCATYTFSMNTGTVTNEAEQQESIVSVAIAFLDDFDLLWNYTGPRLTIWLVSFTCTCKKEEIFCWCLKISGQI